MGLTIDDRAYWDRKNADLKADVAADAEFAATPAGRLARFDRKVAAMHADQSAYTVEQIAAVQAQRDALAADIAQATSSQLATEWTPDVIASRRAALNAFAQTPAAKLPNGQPSPAKLGLWARSQGWEVSDLNRAINLQGA